MDTSYINSIPQGASGRAFLIKDRWDDWGKYQTTFRLVVCDDSGQRFDAGLVKIGQIGLLPSGTIQPGHRSPTLEREFDALDNNYFSLGQDETYYETLNKISGNLRQAVLAGLRDCAFDIQLFEQVIDEEVMRESLLRNVRENNVRNKLHRLSIGNAELTEFRFEYVFPDVVGAPPQPVLAFHVLPDSEPPTNVHVLIGRNGAGKTRCLQFMAKTLLGIKELGELRPIGNNRDNWSFAGFISVSFSAFDDFDLPVVEKSAIRSSVVGLRQKAGEGEGSTVKTPPQLAKDFSSSFKQCRQGLRVERWRSAVQTLENDPLFSEASVTTLLEYSDEEWQSRAENLFSRLSSGHAIVLLTITRLVELVDEQTLVLLDEPESHLHPPLLSAFIRTLTDLLINRNGVAIIATHSPVVLQEVPKSCVWVLRRSGIVSVAERPTIETFGENVGILTREVFGLEVTNAGFLSLLQNAVYVKNLDYKSLLEHFKGQLGAEAQAIARGLIANRDAEVKSRL
jgi:hypothetical protein